MRRIFAVWLAVGLAAVASGEPPARSDSPPLDAGVRILSDWGWGFVAEIRVTNRSSRPTQGWQIILETDARIEDIWGARISSVADSRVLLEAMPWNREIAAGGEIILGFRGTPGRVPVRADAVRAPRGLRSVFPEMHPGPVEVSIRDPRTGYPQDTKIILKNRTWKRLRDWQIELDRDAEGAGWGWSRPAPPRRTRLATPGLLPAMGLAPGRTVEIPLALPGPGPVAWPEIRAVHALIAPDFPVSPSRYARALWMSLLFYEAQRSGRLPGDRRIRWRGDSGLADGADVGIDLTGGYYDAGDHVKFAFPKAAALTLLAWGALEYPEGFRRAGQLRHLLDAIRWGTDWILRAHAGPDIFFAQVGEGVIDHAFWGPPERMTMPRRSFALTPENPGSEVVGEASAALAAASLLFRSEDPSYARQLLAGAERLFAFADRHRGTYSDSLPEAGSHYFSKNGYLDELGWAAAWLAAATGRTEYLDRARGFYARLGGGPRPGSRFSWDDKHGGLAILLARLGAGPHYGDDAAKFLAPWVLGEQGITVTPGGLAWADSWGSLRYAMNAAFLAFVYNDRIRPDPGLREFATVQINYVLGDNPAGRSYMVGFGPTPPRQPHHRAAHGSLVGSIDEPGENAHTLYGALVGGPPRPDDFSFLDDRRDPATNEVALDYNAALTGVLARMVENAAPGGIPRNHPLGLPRRARGKQAAGDGD